MLHDLEMILQYAPCSEPSKDLSPVWYQTAQSPKNTGSTIRECDYR
jgi:hypothetical protein